MAVGSVLGVEVQEEQVHTITKKMEETYITKVSSIFFCGYNELCVRVQGEE